MERFNKTLVEMLRARLQPDQKDWDLHLSACMMAYRSSAHESMYRIQKAPRSNSKVVHVDRLKPYLGTPL